MTFFSFFLGMKPGLIDRGVCVWRATLQMLDGWERPWGESQIRIIKWSPAVSLLIRSCSHSSVPLCACQTPYEKSVTIFCCIAVAFEMHRLCRQLEWCLWANLFLSLNTKIYTAFTELQHSQGLIWHSVLYSLICREVPVVHYLNINMFLNEFLTCCQPHPGTAQCVLCFYDGVFVSEDNFSL